MNERICATIESLHKRAYVPLFFLKEGGRLSFVCGKEYFRTFFMLWNCESVSRCAMMKAAEAKKPLYSNMIVDIMHIMFHGFQGE